jgi:adenylate cyclase
MARMEVGMRTLHRFISIADEATDDDDLRLRKRVGVVAGYILAMAAFFLPLMSQGLAVGWVAGLTMGPVSALNLAVLARTRRFDRYVVLMIVVVTFMPAVVDLALGGMVGSSGGYGFAFLGPLFAILALGPRRATVWFILYLVVLLALILVDPIVSRAIAPQPYPLRLIFWASNFSVPFAIIFFMVRYTELKRREAQALADELLTNAIPVSIAARLKRGERIAEAYPSTTVLFADLVGFTPWARRTDPAQVVSFLDDLFSRFDELAAACGVEKIKTIGDSYMAVAGAPEPRSDHAEAAVALARGMLGVLAEVRDPAGLALEMRIGLASGSVVGGVIGQKRILFDLWGDTVNLASRMESSGVPGRIQVAPSTWELLRNTFALEEREAVEVKGLGVMTPYLLAESTR